MEAEYQKVNVTVHTHHVCHVMISSNVSDSETLSVSCIT